MKPVLLIDFGSTYTKVTAVDVEGEQILGTAQSFTTIETDINDGLNNALSILQEKTGKLDFAENDAVIVGNEGHGLSAQTLALCTDTLYIPMEAGVESLNAGVAASVILWELYRGKR